MIRPFYLDSRYTVCSDGSILGVKGTPLKLAKNRNGYLFFNLWYKGKRKVVMSHRAILKSFVPEPDDRHQINHKDGNKTNNSLDNLEWCTGKENTIHARDVLNKVFPRNKREVEITNRVTGETKIFESLSSCADYLGVSVPAVCRVVKGKREHTRGWLISYRRVANVGLGVGLINR